MLTFAIYLLYCSVGGSAKSRTLRSMGLKNLMFSFIPAFGLKILSIFALNYCSSVYSTVASMILGFSYFELAGIVKSKSSSSSPPSSYSYSKSLLSFFICRMKFAFLASVSSLTLFSSSIFTCSITSSISLSKTLKLLAR